MREGEGPTSKRDGREEIERAKREGRGIPPKVRVSRINSIV